MRQVMAIIDGTGPWRNATYEKAMQHSFCKQISERMRCNAFYRRGPSFDGFRVRHEAHDAAKWLIAAHRVDPDAQICLAGYSRGGSAAVYAAELLKDKEIPVYALFLFDAVARDIWTHGRVIPTNVAYASHAVRSNNAAFVKKYDGRIGGGIGNPARPWFGHTARKHKGATEYHEQEFLGSHGALGGVGWKDITEDADCQWQVAAWMNIRLGACGLPACLRSFPPESLMSPKK